MTTGEEYIFRMIASYRCFNMVDFTSSLTIASSKLYNGILIHLCLKEFPTLFNSANPFRIKGLLGSKFQLKVHSLRKQ